MTTNTVDAIYTRHQRSLMAVGRADDVVLFSLRLALEELAATAATRDAQIAMLTADLERLQAAADTNNAALTDQIAQLDADNAELIRRNKELAGELNACREAATWTVQQLAPAHAAAHNGNAAQSPISNLQSTMWDDPNILTTLDDEATDWWIGCAAGRHTWRTVPKPVQLRMVRHILSFGPESGAMKMTEFDAIKPDWMPTATSHTKTLNLSWQQLNDWRLEL